MKTILTILFLFCSSYAFACDIPKDCWVANDHTIGYCAWASLETLGRFHHIHALYGLMAARKKENLTYPKNLGYTFAIKEKLGGLGVRFWLQDHGNFDASLLKYADSHGCAVCIRAGATKSNLNSAHIIILTHYDDKNVEFYNCNTLGTMWTATRGWFDQSWTGQIVIVEK